MASTRATTSKNQDNQKEAPKTSAYAEFDKTLSKYKKQFFIVLFEIDGEVRSLKAIPENFSPLSALSAIPHVYEYPFMPGQVRFNAKFDDNFMYPARLLSIAKDEKKGEEIALIQAAMEKATSGTKRKADAKETENAKKVASERQMAALSSARRSPRNENPNGDDIVPLTADMELLSKLDAVIAGTEAALKDLGNLKSLGDKSGAEMDFSGPPFLESNDIVKLTAAQLSPTEKPPAAKLPAVFAGLPKALLYPYEQPTSNGIPKVLLVKGPYPVYIHQTKLDYYSKPTNRPSAGRFFKELLDDLFGSHDGIVKLHTRYREIEEQKKLRVVGTHQQQPTGMMQILHPECIAAIKMYLDGLGYTVASGDRLSRTMNAWKKKAFEGARLPI